MRKDYISHLFLILGILLLGFTLRVYGINWDSNQHLHPDERFLTMVGVALRIPATFTDYLDPLKSTLNPYNYESSGFFVYGTLPLTLTKIVAVMTNLDTYDGLVLVGRFLSAMADIGTIIVVYLIAGVLEQKYRLSKNFKYWAAFIYATTVLPIQQSHFFTTDSFSVFFSTAGVWAALKCWQKGIDQSYRYALLGGALFGLAVASKLSSIFVVPLIGGIYIYTTSYNRKTRSSISMLTLHAAIFGLTAYLCLRVGDPRFFATKNLLLPYINPQLLSNLRELRNLSTPFAAFPPGVQWLHTTSLIFPLKNILLWGLGVVSSVLMLYGGALGLNSALRKKQGIYGVLILWMVFFFLYQGSQFVKTMRYFYILYPFFALFAALGVLSLIKRLHSVRPLLSGMMLGIFILLWPLCFMRIYMHGHPYIAASDWVYKNIPAGSTIMLEHWNDVIPLNLPADKDSKTPVRSAHIYTPLEAGVFNPDSPQKIRALDKQLAEADYVILLNKKTYGPIMAASDRYPLMGSWYEDLFEGRKGYVRVEEFTSYPGLEVGTWQLNIPDQGAETAFTEYDHPRVIIFKKNR